MDTKKIAHILAALHREHHEISTTYRLGLSTPIFSIEKTHLFWAKWQPYLRLIVFNKELFETYPWPVVVEILKHEMVHQFVDERLGGGDGKAHGELFQKKAQEIALAPWAKRASIYGDIFAGQSEESPILRKIKKLMALSTSDNIHESMAAMEKVKELSHAHHLENYSEIPEYDTLTIEYKTSRLQAHIYQIGRLLMDHFHVRNIYVPVFVPEANESYMALTMIGKNSHLQIAEYLHGFLCRELPKLWKQQTDYKGMRAKNSYYAGILAGFESQLKKSTKPLSKEEKGLMVKEDQRLQDFFGRRFPSTRKLSHGSRLINKDSYLSGQEEGLNLKWHAGLKKGSEDQPIYLKPHL
jgi:hypothetical protein